MADDRIIAALDVDDFEKMQNLVHTLGDEIAYYKVGMELYYSAGRKTIRFLREEQKKIFLDLKLHDIPNTVAHSVAALTRLGVNLVSIHAQGGRAMMAAAAAAARHTAADLGVERPQIIAITALTSFDETGWQEIGGHLPIAEHVVSLAKLAKEAGLDGVVASPQEAPILRKEIGEDFLIVTPGIRPAFAQTDDQKRIATPAQALRDGASRLVIGRPITQAVDPVAAARMIYQEIEEDCQ